MKTVIEMAREAGLGTTLTHDGSPPRVWIEGADWHDELERFAALVAAAEREACAKVCESEGKRIDASWMSCAAAIRARGQA